jgi:diphthine-ammonia ligase
VFVQAEELPKGALVEFQVDFHTGRPGYGGDEDDDEMEGVFSSGTTSRKGLSWVTSSSEVKGQGGRAIVYLHGMFVFVNVRAELMLDINNLDGEMDDLKSICSGAVSVKAYHLNSTGQESKFTALHHDKADTQYRNSLPI